MNRFQPSHNQDCIPVFPPLASSKRHSQSAEELHDRFVRTLIQLHELGERQWRDNLVKLATHARVQIPFDGLPSGDGINMAMVECLTEIAQRTQYKLPEFVRHFRNEIGTDSRPNKALFELEMPVDDRMVDRFRRWNEIVRQGVCPVWKAERPSRQLQRPKNHASVSDAEVQVRHHLGKGQREGRYLIVDKSMLDIWQEVVISPIGVVQKDGPDGPDVRVINDYSFPDGASVNEFTVRDEFPNVSYNPPSDIARRIHELRSSASGAHDVLMMVGDVSGAFRHVPISADHVHMFAFVFEGLLVIDLACGFGWCGSPAFYSLPGSIINYLFERKCQVNGPAVFGGNVWCDDHTCVEINTSSNCNLSNLSLRRAMATVLGPNAINEKKFTPWSLQCKALGLIWDTAAGVVSIPRDKILKALARVDTHLSTRRATKSEAQKLLGSLRHVASCFLPARAFFQRVQDQSKSWHANCRYTLSDGYLEDLKWFRAVLLRERELNVIPVSYFARLAMPSVHVHMDASDDGVCALEPRMRQYIRWQFTPDQQRAIHAENHPFSINVRELLSATLAALIWGPDWTNSAGDIVHVCFWIDNISAVSWATKRSSPQPMAQLYNRLLSLSEFQYKLAFSAQHIAGNQNIMADAGSRAWTAEHPMFNTWSNLSHSWTQVLVQPPYDDLSLVWEKCCADTPSQSLPRNIMVDIGANGSASPV